MKKLKILKALKHFLITTAIFSGAIYFYNSDYIQTKLEDETFYKKQKLESLYYHEFDNYSGMIKEDNQLKTVIINARNSSISIVIFTDSDNIWYEESYTVSSITKLKKYKFINIHISGVDDINTAGWNKGKFGSGTTSRIK